MKRIELPLLLSLGTLSSVASGSGTIVTFDAGTEGWVGPAGAGGATTIDPAGGHPGANLHTTFEDFGITFRNTTNPAFVGDYTASASVTIAIDLRVEGLDFFGSPVSRPWLVELRDYDDPEPGFPYTSVWYRFGDISAAATSSWTSFAVTIDDTSSTALPEGWGGTGAETGLGEPILPPGRTFADVLAAVDELAFTTLEPGFFFGFTDFDVRIDNVQRSSAATVPLLGPFAATLLALAVAALGVLSLRAGRAARRA